MRLSNQVAIYCAFKEGGRFFYILVKRNKKKGAFWQPITGGEENSDKGDLIRTMIREVKEEIGIDISRKQIVKLPYSFKFICKEGVERTENCFGVLLSLKQKKHISLSEEHTAIIYSSEPKYLKSLLKFQENQIALDKFVKWIKDSQKHYECENS